MVISKPVLICLTQINNNQTLVLNREVGHKKVEYQMDWPPPSISVHHRQQRILKTAKSLSIPYHHIGELAFII